MQIAENGIAELEAKVDTLITIPNERILQVIEKQTPLNEAFAYADDVLAPRHSRHQRSDHAARAHQSRLRRRQDDHDRRGLGDDGNRRRHGRAPRGRRRAKGDRLAAARDHHRRRARRDLQHHRRPGHGDVRSQRSGRNDQPRRRSGRADHLRRVDRSDDERESARHGTGGRLRAAARRTAAPRADTRSTTRQSKQSLRSTWTTSKSRRSCAIAAKPRSQFAVAYRARVLLDSVSPAGVRLTTLEVTFPRFVLAEFNTHRVFSRNSASSRAIPTANSSNVSTTIRVCRWNGAATRPACRPTTC